MNGGRLVAFRECLYRRDLQDLGFGGFEFTWSNKQAGNENIQERLDRVVAMDE